MLVSGRVPSSRNLHLWVPAVTPPKTNLLEPPKLMLGRSSALSKWAISVFQGVRFCFNSEFAIAKGTFSWWKKSCTTTGIGGMKSIPKRTASSSYNLDFTFQGFTAVSGNRLCHKGVRRRIANAELVASLRWGGTEAPPWNLRGMRHRKRHENSLENPQNYPSLPPENMGLTFPKWK